MSMIKPGMFIGDRYEIIENIGSGGMADVYKAKCHRLNRFVAIKILKPEYSSDKNFVTKFRGEAQSCAGLTHPNIVSVFDVGDDGDLHYFVMELIEGITLKRFIERKGRLDIKEAVGIAIQIAQGLDVAHQNHVIHRDIKSQNIIISREGKVKVADFGIAKATTANTINQSAVGSVHYLSPEQARGGYSDERSDIYSLGITMYEMLSGTVPFTGDNSVSVALLHIQGEATPLSELNPSVTPSIEKIVQKCMQKKPERRYMSAAELIQDLKAAIMNPAGDFVKVAPAIVTDSPTRVRTEEELHQIKSASKSNQYFDDEEEYREPVRRSRKNDFEDEDEDLDSATSKWDKALLIASIVLVLLLAFGIIWLVLQAFDLLKQDPEGPLKNVTPSVTASPTPTLPPKVAGMPNLFGQSYEMAEQKLLALGLNLDIKSEDSEEYSEDYPRGTVIEQTPAYGAVLTEGQQIFLVISIGKENITIDNYKGYTKSQLETVIGDSLVIKYKYEESDEVEEDCVIRTDPGPNTQLPSGSTLVVYLNMGGTKVVSVPNVLGKTEADAKQTILNAGLTYHITSDYSAEVTAGLVMSQSPADGELVEGEKVEIVISLGAPPSPTPTPTTEVTPTPTPEPTPTSEPTATPEPSPSPTPTPEPVQEGGQETPSEG